jgi:DNA-binding CsgD family transcriptional regulator
VAGEQPLVGRQPEVATLRAALDRLGAGSGDLVQVTGEPGIGKTRLLSVLADQAADRGCAVFTGRAAEFERQLPFAVVVDALSEGVERLAALPAADRPALGDDVLRLLGTVFPALPTDGAELRDIERYRLHRAVRALLEALTPPAGLVLTLDDLHWADEGSVELLGHLIRHPPRAPVLLAVAYRPRQLTGRAAGVVDSANATRIAVGPLKWTDSAVLLPPELGRAERAALYDASGGNPFYLEELVRLGEPGGEDPLAAELATLPPASLAVLRAAAIAGDEFDVELVAAIANVPVADVFAAVDVLAAHDLVRPVAGTARFTHRHPLVRGAVYRSAGAGWRIIAHRRAAAVLKERGAPATVRAQHLERSADVGDEDALEVLLEAARLTMPTTPASAAHWLEVALRLLPDQASTLERRLGLLAQRARALGVTGRFAEARDVLHQVLGLTPLDATAQRIQVVMFCAVLERLLGRFAEARALLLTEMERQPDPDTPGANLLRYELGLSGMLAGDWDTEQTWTDEVLASARRQQDPVQVAAALGLAASADFLRGRPIQACEAKMTEAARLVDGLTDADLAPRLDALIWLGMIEMYSDRHADAHRHLTRGLALAAATGQDHQVVYLRTLLGTVLAGMGRLREAADMLDDAIELAQLTGSDEQLTMALTQRAWVMSWHEDPQEAVRMADRAVAAAGPGKDWFAAMAPAIRAQALHFAGDPAGCIRALLEAGGGVDLPAMDVPSRISWYQLLAEAEVARGTPRNARQWAMRAERLAAVLDSPRRRGFARLATAYSLLHSDAAAAATIAAEAAGHFRDAGDQVFVGRSLLLAGQALADLGDLDRARSRLAKAIELFTRSGARLFVEQAERARRRPGARRADRGGERGGGSPTDLSVLTERERTVAELVAVGHSNREIAARLYLSPKTVEAHLSRIYHKLGVASRAGLAGIVGHQT